MLLVPAACLPSQWGVWVSWVFRCSLGAAAGLFCGLMEEWEKEDAVAEATEHINVDSMVTGVYK